MTPSRARSSADRVSTSSAPPSWRRAPPPARSGGCAACVGEQVVYRSPRHDTSLRHRRRARNRRQRWPPASSAGAGPPGAGVLVPGKSLGGVRARHDAWPGRGRLGSRVRPLPELRAADALLQHLRAPARGSRRRARRGRVARGLHPLGPARGTRRAASGIGDGVASVTATYGPMRPHVPAAATTPSRSTSRRAVDRRLRRRQRGLGLRPARPARLPVCR